MNANINVGGVLILKLLREMRLNILSTVKQDEFANFELPWGFIPN